MRKILPIIMLLVVAAVGCTKRIYVPVERVSYRDSVQVRLRVDSLTVHDSVFVNQWQRGDTVFRDRVQWRTAYRDRLRVDTVAVTRVDSVPVIKEVVKEQKPTMWQHVKNVINLSLVAIIVGVAIVATLWLTAKLIKKS